MLLIYSLVGAPIIALCTWARHQNDQFQDWLDTNYYQWEFDDVNQTMYMLSGTVVYVTLSPTPNTMEKFIFFLAALIVLDVFSGFRGCYTFICEFLEPSTVSWMEASYYGQEILIHVIILMGTFCTGAGEKFVMILCLYALFILPLAWDSNARYKHILVRSQWDYIMREWF